MDAVTATIELLVGISCVIAGVFALRTVGRRVWVAALLVAGIVAVVHALVGLG